MSKYAEKWLLIDPKYQSLVWRAGIQCIETSNGRAAPAWVAPICGREDLSDATRIWLLIRGQGEEKYRDVTPELLEEMQAEIAVEALVSKGGPPGPAGPKPLATAPDFSGVSYPALPEQVEESVVMEEEDVSESFRAGMAAATRLQEEEEASDPASRQSHGSGGRPRKGADGRGEQLQVRLTKDERERFDEAARAAGLPLSSWVRSVCMRASQ